MLLATGQVVPDTDLKWECASCTIVSLLSFINDTYYFTKTHVDLIKEDTEDNE